jgi:hypothetical protein
MLYSLSHLHERRREFFDGGRTVLQKGGIITFAHNLKVKPFKSISLEDSSVFSI